jgi:hypothetical protein
MDTDMANFTLAHERRIMSPVAFTVESRHANFSQVRVRAKNDSIVDETVSARKSG